MSTGDRAADLRAIRARLPELVGPDWERIRDAVEALFDQLDRATSDEERQRLAEELIDRLYVYAGFRRALTTRGRRRGVSSESYAFEPPPSALESSTPVPTDAPPPEDPVGVIERTPHLDVDAQQPVAVGRRFTVRVWLDTEAPRAGELSTSPIVLPALSELQLRVWLIVSDQFSIVGDGTGVITVRAAEPRSSEVTFTVECTGAGSGEAGITAAFAYGIRPAGSVARIVEVEGGATGGERTVPEPAMQVDATAQQPDLVVQVLPNPDGDERHFVMKITSPRLVEYAAGIEVPWRLPSATKTLVEGYFDAFTTVDRGGRKAALIGAGRELFSATPKAFRHAIWKLAELGDPAVKSILVVTSEPHIPWELMVPNDGQRSMGALGVDFAVGRWVHVQQYAPQQAIPIVDSSVIAPTYRGSKVLGFSADEAQYVIDAFHGMRIDPALLQHIDKALGQRAPTLLHFICHGVNGAAGQILELDPDEQLREIQLGGMEGVVKAVAESKPFVFINACEVGRIAPGLVGTAGFASRFIGLGARCVVAPIWSVKDDVAGTVAREFYDAVRADPSRPFAAVLRDIRRRAYEGTDPEDSYAAYCFYGDPLAAQVP